MIQFKIQFHCQFNFDSLNKDRRQRDSMRVKNENQALLMRIQEKESQYNHLQWVDEWCHHNCYTSNVSKYPQNWINDVKVSSWMCGRQYETISY